MTRVSPAAHEEAYTDWEQEPTAALHRTGFECVTQRPTERY